MSFECAQQDHYKTYTRLVSTTSTGLSSSSDGFWGSGEAGHGLSTRGFFWVCVRRSSSLLDVVSEMIQIKQVMAYNESFSASSSTFILRFGVAFLDEELRKKRGHFESKTWQTLTAPQIWTRQQSKVRQSQNSQQFRLTSLQRAY